MPLKPMLAKEPNWAKVKFPLVIQPKLDGIRAHVQRDDAGRIRVFSRSLKLIPNGEIQAALAREEFLGLDGEIIVGDPTAEDCYRTTSSFAMSVSKRGAPWTFYVFDRVDQPHLSATLRDQGLVNVVRSLRAEGHDFIEKVASVTCDSMEELDRVEAFMLEQGHEGAIARVPGAAYKHGRSTPSGPLIKVKRFIDFEAEVIGVYEENHNANAAVTNELGRTARSTAKDGLIGKGTLGGLVVRALNGPAEGIEFKVGTGFSAAERKVLWINSTNGGLNGRVAKVKSFPIGVKDKPRHPVFLGWREEADR
jgi:DNA ligase-1